MGMRFLLAIVAFFGLGGLVGGVALGPATPSAAKPKYAAPVLAQRMLYGGRCLEGGCVSTMTIRTDGSVAATVGSSAPRQFKLSSARITRLVKLVASTKADPATLPTSTNCPPTYDGQAVRYVLAWRNTTRTYDQCEVTIPSGGVFAELDRLWALAFPAPS